MNGDSVCFSRKSDEWETPQSLFDKLNQEFHFTFDAAATKENSKCGSSYADILGDALTITWHYHSQGGAIWLNPPYSKIGRFIQKAYFESVVGNATIVCLIPARTDTKWWHEYVMRAGEVRLIKGRLKFNGSKNSAPFPSAIVIFYPGVNTSWPQFSSFSCEVEA